MTIAILIVCFEAVASAILRGPSNLAVVVGTNMTMTCGPTPGTNMVDWYHTPVRSKDTTHTLLRINHGSRIQKNFSEFSVEGKIPGELLNLKITQMKHAGFYQCSATGQKAAAQLVVLASEPRCNFSTHVIEEVTRVNLFCSVSYNGYWVPTMEWSPTAAVSTTVTTPVTTPVKEYAMESFENELTSNLSLIINSSTQGSRYSCKTYFTKILSSQASTTASNIPKYESIWTSPNIEMLYGPKNVTVSPTKDIFHSGDVLTCSANSTQSSVIEWTEMVTGNVFKGPTIVINASMVRHEPYIFSCTAINKLTRAYVKSNLFTFIVKRKFVEGEFNVTTDISANQSFGTSLGVYTYTVPLITSSLIVLGLLSLIVVTTRKKRISRVMPSVNIEMESENQNNDYDSHNGYSRAFSSRTDAGVNNDNRLSTSRRMLERFGADGTVYMEMSNIQPQQIISNPRKPLYPPMFSKSVYASIDHGLEPPPLSSK